ncbi:coiled-coil domain-containing protein 17 isoform X2 [Apus apus]|uniref:coiled-coil domain-containing protein 17 isoform X2 n=1 Tax=Apus apus TaxID=8895 RepID=UPI0021F8D20E|nr:coiled-coil domain-containing protein 17 isoform X2 [Apus apus]
MAGRGGFPCPRCRMALGSRALLRAHEEKLCLGTGSAGRPGGDVSAKGAPDTAGRPQDASVEVSQHGACSEPRRLLVLPGPPRAVPGQGGPGRAQGAPLGAVLTPRERALLRGADPPARRLAAEGRPSPQAAPPRGQQEQLEAHKRHVAEIQAKIQQLELQREGLCQRLAALRARAAAEPQPQQGELEMIQAPEVLQHQGRGLAHERAALRLDTLLPAAGPLAAEARALRLAYLRAGGHDPAILAQLVHLQMEAMVLEKGSTGLHRRMGEPQPRAHPLAGTLAPPPAAEVPLAVLAEPPGTGAPGLDTALLAVELENRRLEDELLALKVRRERRADAGSQVARWHAEELAQLQAEVGMLRQHTEQTGPRLPPSILPPPVAPPLPPALAAPEIFMEAPGPALGTGSPKARSHTLGPSSLPLTSFAALEDPPPAREPPAQHKPPQRGSLTSSSRLNPRNKQNPW